MDPRLFFEADPAAQALFGAILFVILVGTAFKLFAPPHWDDWLDEHWGRGSVRDTWLLDRIARRRGDG